MNIRDLRYFVAVAEREHFGKAAKDCHVSQPTLSGQIKKLEEELGITLFERTNRRVMLTEIGGRMLLLAHRVLREVEGIEELAHTAQDPFAGKFRLGAFPTLAPYLLPALVPQVMQALPDIRLILLEEKTEQLLQKLHQGTLDAALLALPIHDDYLHYQPLFDDAFFLATAPNHPLAQESIITQQMLAPYRLLLLEEGHCLRDQALEVCQLHGIAEGQDFKATSLETLRQMVKAGTGITFMPEIAMHPKEEGICYTPFAAPSPMRRIGLVWRKTSPRAAVIEALLGLEVLQPHASR